MDLSPQDTSTTLSNGNNVANNPVSKLFSIHGYKAGRDGGEVGKLAR